MNEQIYIKSNNLKLKLQLFEYFVVKILEWKEEFDINKSIGFTKLQLHKLLFLASASNATLENQGMLSVFDKFYALQYGPVELDIYRAMTDNIFSVLTFESRLCKIKNLAPDYFLSLNSESKAIVDEAIISLRQKSNEYVLYDPFKLVNITHEWSVWKTAFSYAEFIGAKMRLMSTRDIITSNIKSF